MSTELAGALNRDCACESKASDAVPGFYSNVPVFVGEAHVAAMHELIAVVQRVAGLPAYQAAVLGGTVPQAEPRARGVFMGFDFHVAEDGPRLIEINTNAGGAMLNAVAAWRHPLCCSDANPAIRLPPPRTELEGIFVAMFRNEWRLARGDQPLRRIAIVDDEPARQFLFAEFRLFVELFAAAGIEAFIADAAELEMLNGRLSHQGRDIDLVYNRVTDFDLARPEHVALRRAYESDAAVITPHPRAHALYADKCNLVRLTDEAFLKSVGAAEGDIATLLAGIPRTQLVDNSDTWWRDRKGWFFKPMSGFGSRGVYRGDKLTRRVFGELVRGGYIAQELAVPGERLNLKADLRHYVYEGRSQFMAARLYQGQTTNFRTAGGGFAPVLTLLAGFPDEQVLARCVKTGEIRE